MRSLHGRLDTIDESGLEGGDHYRVVLWPSPPAEVQVVKLWAMAE